MAGKVLRKAYKKLDGIAAKIGKGKYKIGGK